MHAVFRAGLVLAATATLAGPALAQNDSGRKLTTMLMGSAERPGPGDADGHGMFEARINPGQGQLCYTLTVERIDPATMAHIHLGGPRVSGAVVVALAAPTSGRSEACIAIDRTLAQKLIRDPGAYYVNVHNAAFPNGAIRGQLGK